MFIKFVGVLSSKDFGAQGQRGRKHGYKISKTCNGTAAPSIVRLHGQTVNPSFIDEIQPEQQSKNKNTKDLRKKHKRLKGKKTTQAAKAAKTSQDKDRCTKQQTNTK